MNTSTQSNRRLFWAIFLFHGLWVLCLNFLNGYYSDDYGYAISNGIFDIFAREYQQYHYWGGRSVAHIFVRLLLTQDLWLFNLLNTFVYCLMTYLIYLHAVGKEKYRIDIYLFIISCLWLFIPVYGQVIFWVSGSVNYLWMFVFMLAALLPFSFYKNGDLQIKNPFAFYSLLLILSFCAGWGNENTSGGYILIMLFFIADSLLKREKVPFFMFFQVIISSISFFLMIVAPGNYVRTDAANAVKEYNMLEKMEQVVLALLNHFDFFLQFILVLIVIAVHHYRNDLNRFTVAIFFFLSALATAAALIFMPFIPSRALFGVAGFFTLSSACFLGKMKDFLLKYSTFYHIFLTILCFQFASSLFIHSGKIYTSYCNYLDFATEIEHCQEQGISSVVLPVYTVETPYFSTDMQGYNQIIGMEGGVLEYYGFDSVVQLPEAEWRALYPDRVHFGK